MDVPTKAFEESNCWTVLTLRLSSGVTARLSVPPPSAKGCCMPWKLTLFQYLQEDTGHVHVDIIKRLHAIFDEVLQTKIGLSAFCNKIGYGGHVTSYQPWLRLRFPTADSCRRPGETVLPSRNQQLRLNYNHSVRQRCTEFTHCNSSVPVSSFSASESAGVAPWAKKDDEIPAATFNGTRKLELTSVLMGNSWLLAAAAAGTPEPAVAALFVALGAAPFTAAVLEACAAPGGAAAVVACSSCLSRLPLAVLGRIP